MTTMSDSAASPRGLFALALLEMRGVGNAGARRIVHRLGGRALVDGTSDVTASVSGIFDSKKIGEFRQALERASALLNDLSSTGVSVIVYGDDAYPSQLTLLGDQAPFVLMVKGNRDLLNCAGVGFCGSRKASERGLSAAADFAEQLAAKRINVVSGYAAGVDTAVHVAALRAGGSTTVVLPLGILHFRIKAELQQYWDWARILVMSQFPAKLPWQARNAMVRNGTICALSDALVVVEAGAEGGTLEAGRTGLQLGLPVFALQYEPESEVAPGNRILMSLGAHPLGRSRTSGRANADRVLTMVRSRDRGHLSFL